MAATKPSAISRIDIREQFAADLDWYERHATRSRRIYQGLVAAGFALGIAVVVAGILHAVPELTAILGAAISGTATLLGISRAQENSVRFRMTRAALEAERLEWSQGAAGYTGLDDETALRRLTVRRNAIVTAEYAEWQSMAITEEPDGRAARGGAPAGQTPQNVDP